MLNPIWQPKGLILAGGDSIRMGQDKQHLSIPGKSTSFLEHTIELLQPLCSEVYLSLKQPYSNSLNLPIIQDPYAIGPLGGIIAAFEAICSPWLVIACDLPLMKTSLLKNLIQNHSQQKQATLWKCPQGKIEPLCGIYNPSLLPILKTYQTQKQYSLTRILKTVEVHYLTIEDANAFANINDRQTYQNLKNQWESNT